MHKSAVASAGLAPIALIGGWTWAAARQPAGFDPMRDTISALAAHGAKDPWIMTTGLALLGACHLVTAAAMPEAGPAGRSMLALGGAATIAVSALPQPAFGHVPAATVGFIALAVWPAMSRVPSRRWRIAATATSVGLLGWLAVGLKTGDLLGLSERVLAGVESVVPLAVVLGLLTRRKTALDPR